MKPLEIYGHRMGIIGNSDDSMAFLLRGIDGVLLDVGIECGISPSKYVCECL